MNYLYPDIAVFPWTGHSSAELAGLLELHGPLLLWDQHPQAGQKEAFAYHQPGRYSYIGLLPRRVLELHRNDPTAADPFEKLSTLLSENSNWARTKELQQRFDFELPPFLGGGAGFISYDSVRFLEHIAGCSGHPCQPDAFILDLDTLLVIDRQTEQLLLIQWPESKISNCSRQRESELSRIKAVLPKLSPPQPQTALSQPLSASQLFEPLHDKAAFMKMVQRAKEYICAGDVFQVVLANTLQSACRPDPLLFYHQLLSKNPSPYHFLVRFGEQTLVGASPEVLLCGLRRPGSEHESIAMRLVAGTYPRTAGAHDETRACADLQADPKEHAEHVMLVDHGRNDIGRVSEIGSVRVDGLCSVETYADVHHLVSQVSGSLRRKESMLTALRACFPIATLTGTPKIRAMEIIAELEGPSRGIFGGAVVLLGHDSFMDSGVVIRSAVIGPQGTSVQAGAGIVYDSEPAREYEECLWKAKAILEVAASVEAAQ